MSDGELAGSNFLTVVDEVAGVGPITVDPAFQGRDIGRQLMLDVLAKRAIAASSRCAWCKKRSTRVPLALRRPWIRDASRPSPHAPSGGRVRGRHRASWNFNGSLHPRRLLPPRLQNHEARGVVILEVGFPAFVREREGRICAYLIPGLLGHGVAENEADAVALATQAARRASDLIVVFCPLDEHPLFRAFLQAGF